MTQIVKTCIFSLALLLAVTLNVLSQTPATIERELIRHLDNISKYGNYADSRDEAKLERENDALERKLIRYGKRAAVLQYAFSKLKGKMFVSTSKDGKFRTYSWDRESGGTMHDHATVFQFRGKSGRVYTWTAPGSSEEEFGGFYHQIFQTDTPSGRVYLANSTFMASTSLSGQQLGLFRIIGEKLDPNVRLIRTGSGLRNSVGFQYDFFSVVDRAERPIQLFTYDEKRKAFSFPIVIEDSKTPQGRVTDKMITYSFNGKYFVKER